MCAPPMGWWCQDRPRNAKFVSRLCQIFTYTEKTSVELSLQSSVSYIVRKRVQRQIQNSLNCIDIFFRSGVLTFDMNFTANGLLISMFQCIS